MVTGVDGVVLSVQIVNIFGPVDLERLDVGDEMHRNHRQHLFKRWLEEAVVAPGVQLSLIHI